MNTREIPITSSLLIHSNTSLNPTIKTTTSRSMHTLVRGLSIAVDDRRELPIPRRSTASHPCSLFSIHGWSPCVANFSALNGELIPALHTRALAPARPYITELACLGERCFGRLLPSVPLSRRVFWRVPRRRWCRRCSRSWSERPRRFGSLTGGLVDDDGESAELVVRSERPADLARWWRGLELGVSRSLSLRWLAAFDVPRALALFGDSPLSACLHACMCVYQCANFAPLGPRSPSCCVAESSKQRKAV